MKIFRHSNSSIFTEKLVLPRHARCVLFLLRYNEYSLRLNSHLSRILELRVLVTAPVAIRPKTSLISFYTVLLRTLCVARFLAIPFLATNSGPSLGKLPGFMNSMVSCHALPFIERGSGNHDNKNNLDKIAKKIQFPNKSVFRPISLHFKKCFSCLWYFVGPLFAWVISCFCK